MMWQRLDVNGGFDEVIGVHRSETRYGILEACSVPKVRPLCDALLNGARSRTGLLVRPGRGEVPQAQRSGSIGNKSDVIKPGITGFVCLSASCSQPVTKPWLARQTQNP